MSSSPSRKRARSASAGPVARRWRARVGRELGGPMEHRFTRVINVSQSIKKLEAENRYALAFRFDATPGYEDLKGLFDSYKIEKVELTFLYNHNSSNAPEEPSPELQSVSLPVLYVTEDNDDAEAVSASMFNIQQYKRVKFGRLDKPITYTVRPKVATALYNGVVSTGYGMSRSMWIDNEYAGVEHYGAKWTVNPAVAGTAGEIMGNLQVICKYFLVFRASR